MPVSTPFVFAINVDKPSSLSYETSEGRGSDTRSQPRRRSSQSSRSQNRYRGNQNRYRGPSNRHPNRRRRNQKPQGFWQRLFKRLKTFFKGTPEPPKPNPNRRRRRRRRPQQGSDFSNQNYRNGNQRRNPDRHRYRGQEGQYENRPRRSESAQPTRSSQDDTEA